MGGVGWTVAPLTVPRTLRADAWLLAAPLAVATERRAAHLVGAHLTEETGGLSVGDSPARGSVKRNANRTLPAVLENNPKLYFERPTIT